MEPLVSIVTPCYNGEKFIDAYANSVIDQTYKNLEVIIVNDGSKDNSLEKLKCWEKIFQQKKIKIRIVDKENGGQPTAINAGLKYVSGEYLTWPDIDDIMHPDYIEKKVEVLMKNTELDMLITKSAVKNIDNQEKILAYTWPSEPNGRKDLLDRILNDRSFYYEPGAFMVRVSTLDKIIKDGHIYDECGIWSGPQTQMVTPFIYYGKVGYCDACLYDYFIHSSNDHNKFKTVEELQFKSEKVKEMLYAVVKGLNAKDELVMLDIIDRRMQHNDLVTAFKMKNKQWFMDVYSNIEKGKLEKKDKMRCFFIRNKFNYFIYTVAYKLKRKQLFG